MSPRKRPELASIVIPVRNGGRYLGLAIQSALAQSWPAVEVIVVDHGSDDDGYAQAVIASYADRIRLIYHPQGDLTGALNAGIAASRGRYFCWLSHDGLYHPKKIEHQVAALTGLPGPAIAFSDVAEIDRVGRPLTIRDVTGVFDPRCPLWTALQRRVNGCSLLIPRECFDECGVFDPSFKVAFDDDLLLRMAERYPLVAVPGALVRQRLYEVPDLFSPLEVAERTRTLCNLLRRLAPLTMQTHAGSELMFLKRVQQLLEPTPYCEAQVCVAEMIAAQEARESIAIIWVADGRGRDPAHLLAAAKRAELRVAEVLCLDATASGELSHRVRRAGYEANWPYRRLPCGARLPEIASLALAETTSPTLLFADADTSVVPAALRCAIREIMDGATRARLGGDDRDCPSLPLPASVRNSIMRRSAVAAALAPRLGVAAAGPAAPGSSAPVPAASPHSPRAVADEKLRLAEDEIVVSSLFDANWYRREYPDIARSWASLVQHYVITGASQGHDPNPLFDTDWYLSRHPEVGKQALNPLLHFIRTGAAADNDPHPLFDMKWYRAQYLDSKQAINPLAHYLFVGVRLALRPNSVFDPALYRRIYPDCLTGDGDPLTHYRRIGASQNRLPSTEFSPELYAEQLSGSERATCRGRLVEHYLRDGRPRGLAAGWYDGRGTGGNGAWRLVAGLDPGKPTLVLIGAAGEAITALRDLASRWRDRINVLFLSPRPDGVLVLSPPDGDAIASVALDPNTRLDDLVALLKDCRVARLQVHDPKGVRRLRELIHQLGVPYDVAIHDYYLLAPQPCLVDADGRFVGEELAAAEEALCALSVAQEPVWSLRSWRRQKRWLLDGSARVIALSRDAARRFRLNYPELRVVAACPEMLGGYGWSGPGGKLEASEALRVAVLGPLERHSGYGIVLEAARLAGRSGAILKFELISGSIDDGGLREAGVTIGGESANGEVVDTLLRSRPHLLWYPSQWPEVFSDRLIAGLRSGLPLAVADIGALPEWTDGRSWSWVRPWTWTAAEWLHFFGDIRERHFVSGSAPQPSVLGVWSDRSYDDLCVDWLDHQPATASGRIRSFSASW